MVERAKPDECGNKGDTPGTTGESGLSTNLCEQTRTADVKPAAATASGGEKVIPVALQDANIPPDILQPTDASVQKYNQLVGSLVEKKLMEHPDATTGSKKPDINDPHGEAASPLDRELSGLTNAQLAERLKRDQNDPALRAIFEERFKDEMLKTSIVQALYENLAAPGSSDANQKLAAQLKADWIDPQKRAHLLANFQTQFIDKYGALLSNKSSPNYNERTAALMGDLKDDWMNPDKRASLKDQIFWPGKGRNCCCASERDKATGMISWIETGRRAQNAACHGNYLEQYFPPKSIEFKKT